MDTTQNIISLCSGYGGLDRGIELAGVKTRVVSYVEIEAFAIANLVAKMETGLLVPAPVWTNLKTFPMESFRGRVHGITAGYPCQPFSVAGQRKGTDDPRHLWPYIKRAISIIRPVWCFFENVEGHVTLGLSTVISDLEELGYRVEAGLFSAAEVGAPHRRKRVFILAHAGCVGQTLGQEQTAGLVKSRELGNSTDERLQNGRIESLGQQEEVSESERPDRKAELVNSQSRINGQQPTEQQGRNGGKLPKFAVKWPARPGSPQHEWEKPRVAQPGLGGKPDGSSSRVDRLRLLGNGVVPQQAARAYQVLNERMQNET